MDDSSALEGLPPTGPTAPAEDPAPPVPAPAPPATRLRKQTWIAIGILFSLALLLRFNVRQGQVSGPSMIPTYEDGNTVLVWTSVPRSWLKPGDVIVFRDTNGDELIKRIAFIRAWQPTPPPGDWTTINGGRQVPYSLLFGPYFQNRARYHLPPLAPDRVVYVLGDNLNESDDSRHIGPIRYKQILGKVVP